MIVNNKTGEITVGELEKEIDMYDGPVCPEPLIQYSDKTDRIEQVIKALGTMVLFPQEISDPNNIGQKVYGQPIQRPILEGEARTKVLNKLVELITE